MLLTLDFVTLQDAVLTAIPRDGLQTAADISLVVMAVGSGVALIAVAVVLLQIRKLLRSLNEQVRPITERAKTAAENVEYVSAMVREDVQKVNASIGAITDRLNEASDHMEDRVQEFNALMEVVQGEAERVFIDTAVAVRGVQAGAQSIRRPEVTPESGDDVAPASDVEGESKVEANQ
jgi:methyl-accepting chemotaxis protein